MKLKYIVYSLLILGLAGLIVYRINSNKAVTASGQVGGGKPGAGGGGVPPMRVDAIVLKPQPFSNALQVSGSIEADEQVQIRSEVSGVVRSINFEEGSKVSKGQVLLRVDDSELRAQLAQVQTRQQLAFENNCRAALLLEKEAISREEYEVANAELLSTRAQTQLVQAQLAKTTIRAPFTGRIGLRSISEGAIISPDAVVANLVATDPVKITFSVPEKYAAQVRMGSKISFTVAGSDERQTATVYAIEPGIETTTRTLQLRARAANPNGNLLPGSFANIELPLAEITDALLVPTQAVVPIQNGKKVFVARNGKAKEVIVETSTRTQSDVLVTSGLSAGDTVLTTGIMTLKEGTPVRVRINEPSAVTAATPASPANPGPAPAGSSPANRD